MVTQVDVGVLLCASNLKSLTLLHEFIETTHIQYSNSNSFVGPIREQDVLFAFNMLSTKYSVAAILAFWVDVECERVQILADSLGVKIFTCTTCLYDLCDKVHSHLDHMNYQCREQYRDMACFPFEFKIYAICHDSKKYFNVSGELVSGKIRLGCNVSTTLQESIIRTDGIVTRIVLNGEDITELSTKNISCNVIIGFPDDVRMCNFDHLFSKVIFNINIIYYLLLIYQ